MNTHTTAHPPPEFSTLVKTSPVLLIAAVMLATVMQSLDTTIANVALPEIQGTLVATQDQTAWILTSYIVAAAIMTPVTGWLAQAMGRRSLLLTSIGGFTIASLFCGIAQSIEQMVLARLLQGLFGAALIPISQSLLLDVFPKEKHGPAMALWGMGIMVGPILGPPLGGYLTEFHSWRWVFLINLPVGALAMMGVLASINTEPTQRRPFDWTGLLLLSLGIGGLQLFLDRGQGQNWWSSTEIQIEAAAAFLGLYLYALYWKSREHVLLDLHLFANRNFAVSSILIFTVGLVLFSTLALLPAYLAQWMSYPVFDIGILIAPRGVGTMAGMMVAGKLITKMDPRWLIGSGMLLTLFSLHLMSQFGVSVDPSGVMLMGLIQGVGLGLVFIPVNALAYATLPPHQRTEAASLFSLVRGIGSSIGISVMVTLLARNTQAFHAHISERLTTENANLLPDLLQSEQGLLLLNGEVTRQAAILAYVNDFWLLMVLTAIVCPLVYLLKPTLTPKTDVAQAEG